MQRVRLWGTRGSIPIALTAAGVRAKIEAALKGSRGRPIDTDAGLAEYMASLELHQAGTYGGHSSCVEIETGTGEYVLCDLGSGARPFAQGAMARHGPGNPQTYHVFMSHLHWDHIMGLPFFTPAYLAGNRIFIYGCHARLREAFVRQQAEPSFPVDFSVLAAKIEFVTLTPGETREIAGMRVTPKLQMHAGDSYGYRFEARGKTFVYSTDSEHKLDDPQETEGFVEFFRDADLVVFDAMYSLADAISVKADWGHSSNVVGVELCQLAGVKHLCMYHHEPAFDDAAIARVLADTRRFEEITRNGAQLIVSAAYDGMEIEL
ncbi:MAG: MBL fold metallo-hydrolase [Burkholderiales bacterium]|nr:MBL fold metallo-hydrolase [Burkholderiales bacterium]